MLLKLLQFLRLHRRLVTHLVLNSSRRIRKHKALLSKSNQFLPILLETAVSNGNVNVIRPSDSIESPPAIPPPIVNDPGRPLPLIKPESAPIAALTYGFHS